MKPEHSTTIYPELHPHAQCFRIMDTMLSVNESNHCGFFLSFFFCHLKRVSPNRKSIRSSQYSDNHYILLKDYANPIKIKGLSLSLSLCLSLSLLSSGQALASYTSSRSELVHFYEFTRTCCATRSGLVGLEFFLNLWTSTDDSFGSFVYLSSCLASSVYFYLVVHWCYEANVANNDRSPPV